MPKRTREEDSEVVSAPKRNQVVVDIHAFWKAIQEGSLDVVKWMYYSLGGCTGGFDIHTDNDTAFYLACTLGRLELAQWLWSLGGIDLHANNDDVFHATCGNGYLEVAQWLWSLDGKIQLHVDGQSAWGYACYRNQLEMAEWLYSIDRELDIHHKNDIAFRQACKRFRLRMARWIYSLDGKIAARLREDAAFRQLCFSEACNSDQLDAEDQLKMVQWLWSLSGSIDLTERKYHVIRAAFLRHKLELSKWLCSLEKVDIRSLRLPQHTIAWANTWFESNTS